MFRVDQCGKEGVIQSLCLAYMMTHDDNELTACTVSVAIAFECHRPSHLFAQEFSGMTNCAIAILLLMLGVQIFVTTAP